MNNDGLPAARGNGAYRLVSRSLLIKSVAGIVGVAIAAVLWGAFQPTEWASLPLWLQEAISKLNPQYWESFGAAAQGLVGTVVGFLGALMGITIAQLGLETAKDAQGREDAIVLQEALEKAVPPFFRLAAALESIVAGPVLSDEKNAALLSKWAILRSLAREVCQELDKKDPGAERSVDWCFSSLASYASLRGLEYQETPQSEEEVLSSGCADIQRAVNDIEEALGELQKNPLSLLLLKTVLQQEKYHDPLAMIFTEIRSWSHAANLCWKRRDDHAKRMDWYEWLGTVCGEMIQISRANVQAGLIESRWPLLDPAEFDSNSRRSPTNLRLLFKLVPTGRDIDAFGKQILDDTELGRRPTKILRIYSEACEAALSNQARRFSDLASNISIRAKVTNPQEAWDELVGPADRKFDELRELMLR